jgi:hypothetical protein
MTASRPGQDGFRIDPEFEVLCPMHTDEERRLLEESVVAHGVREPFVVWKGANVLLDGHTRLLICRAHGIKFDVVEYDFPDRVSAKNWLIDNQLARRNLTREQRDYLIGKRYLEQRKDKNENLRPDAASPTGQCDPSERVSAQVAKVAGVSEKTVRRAAEFAQSVDRLAETCPSAKAAILTGKVKLSREEVARAAEKSPRSIAQVRKAARTRTAPAREARDHVGAIASLALRLSAAIDSYSKSGLRSSDRPRLTSLWDLRAEIEGLNAALAGGR